MPQFALYNDVKQFALRGLRVAGARRASLLMAFARIAPGCWILAIASAVTPVYAQTSQTAADNRSESYFNFSMGHLYAEMAGSYGNRGEYVNKAIDYYKQALKLDPAPPLSRKSLRIFTCRPARWSGRRK